MGLLPSWPSRLKVIVDVGVGLAAERTLRKSGHDTLCVRDVDPRMPDTEILERAAAQGRLLITMDKALGDLAVRHGCAHAGVLLMRLEEATGDEKAQVVDQRLSEHGDRLAGRFAVFQSGRLRIRRHS